VNLDLNQIREDLNLLSKFDVVLFGSTTRGESRPGSDIDIAVITRDSDQDANFLLYKDIISRFPPRYDLKLFELLPLKIQISIADDFRPLFGNAVELSEYFYIFRVRWDDCKRRMFENMFESAIEQIAILRDRKNKNYSRRQSIA